MNSSVIGKIEKARYYARERTRMRFTDFTINFRGDNDTHRVTYNDEHWHCSCDFFEGYGVCAHTMALERVLEGMLAPSAISTASVGH
jgi:hypothetical protein